MRTYTLLSDGQFLGFGFIKEINTLYQGYIILFETCTFQNGNAMQGFMNSNRTIQDFFPHPNYQAIISSLLDTAIPNRAANALTYTAVESNVPNAMPFIV